MWIPFQWLIPITGLALVLKSEIFEYFKKQISLEIPNFDFAKVIFLALGDLNPINYNDLCVYCSQIDSIQPKLAKPLMERWRWSEWKINDYNPTRLWWTDVLASHCSPVYNPSLWVWVGPVFCFQSTEYCKGDGMSSSRLVYMAKVLRAHLIVLCL